MVFIGFVPLFFQKDFFIFVCIALGYIEAIAHLLAIKIFKKTRYPYSSGLFTALSILLPISIYTTWQMYHYGLMQLHLFISAFCCLVVIVMLAQQVIVRLSGMKYFDFLKNVKQALFSR